MDIFEKLVLGNLVIFILCIVRFRYLNLDIKDGSIAINVVFFWFVATLISVATALCVRTGIVF